MKTIVKGKNCGDVKKLFLASLSEFKAALTQRQKLLCRIVRGALTVLLAFMLILYGPFKRFTDLYIMTAVRTSDHKYLATMLYSDKYISKVKSRNGIETMNGLSDYVPSPYEGCDIIEEEDISGAGYRGKLLTVYDETRVRIVAASSEGGQLLESIAGRYNAVAAINASGYTSNRYKGLPYGFVMYNGRSVGAEEDRTRSFVAVDYDNRIYVGSLNTGQILGAGFRDVLEFGPLLVLNGEPCDISGNGGGIAPRTAIGITEDRKILLLVIDGRDTQSLGASHREVQRIMIEHGAVNVCNLDGGYSTSMYYKGEIVNSTGLISERVLPNAIIVE